MDLAVSGRKIIGVFLVMMAATSVALPQSEPDAIEAGKFSAAAPGVSLPDGWKHVTFKKIKHHTRYSLVRDKSRIVVRAESRQSASLLSKKIRIDPKQYPIIDWQWKVANIISKGDVSQKEGDDYPTRIFIIFSGNSSRAGLPDKARYKVQPSLFDGYKQLRAITYIWGNKAAAGTMVPNPFSDRVVMFVVRSGSKNLNTWLKERRNVYEDYKRAFDKKPPMISGIAIMTDSDNTAESTTAFYGDITFRKRNPDSLKEGTSKR
jgi:hypothetical protein